MSDVVMRNNVVMSNEFNFENLQVYQRALSFSNEVYTVTRKWPRDAFFLADQLRRASLSITLNIAEGASRTRVEFRRFISISRGSCHECVPLTDIAFKQKLINSETKDKWLEETTAMSKMLSKLKSSIKIS